MKTWHIHIGGLVQGVGFRPYIFRLAETGKLNGWISNSKNGVHIEINADEKTALNFLNAILQSPPGNAVITHHHLSEIPDQNFQSFLIKKDDTGYQPDLLLTPDFAICDSCRKEIADDANRRFQYPFTTCLQCGPRYSIIRSLPYERQHTSMNNLEMCNACSVEYNDVHNRRHYSQTNSCSNCAIPMYMYAAGGLKLSEEADSILKKINTFLEEGAIVAVKGIGGYLLLCDATNEITIQTLRHRKHRPARPFALLYDTIETARADLDISAEEEALLKDKSGPIVLCRMKDISENKICKDVISPGLDKVGFMLPCSPLLQLIASAFKKPLIATSGNSSGSPIIYKDEEAVELLSGIADYIITYDREIILPQDDSVMQLTETGEKIILRRSRGLAPNYFPCPFEPIEECVLATGGELKSAFALQHRHLLYISQYLGNQENLTSQSAFVQSTGHMMQLLQTTPTLLLIDKHPGYFVSRYADEIAMTENIPILKIQHHEAHFGAVLAENNLLNSTEPVLGIIWDGTGYGDDEQIWGGEFFIYENHEMTRVAQFDYFSQLLGDKMSREPRLSALSLLKFVPAASHNMQKHFSDTEWKYYQQLIRQPAALLTSSMGRFLDGIASLLNICHINSYEGEAAMKLEAHARNYTGSIKDEYPLPLKNGRIDFSYMLQTLLADVNRKILTGYIARKVFYSLAVCISRVSDYFSIDRIAFSGGVFQNALLTDMINELLKEKKELYRHKHTSPNDECIGLGQLACYHLLLKNKNDTPVGAVKMQPELHY